jgi:excisionase family DNA binding protein
MSERKTMTVEQAARVLGVGRNSAYQAARAGQIPAIRIGKRLIVPTAAFEKFLATEPKRDAKKGL